MKKFDSLDEYLDKNLDNSIEDDTNHEKSQQMSFDDF